MQTIFADGIANISLIDGVARIELVNIIRIDNDQIDFKPTCVIAMSLQGMLRMQDQLQKAIDRMEEDGLLKKRDALTDPDADPA